jgi:cytoskeletal protein CcmA (bactofilin family)
MQCQMRVAMDDSVSRVVATLVAHHKIEVIGNAQLYGDISAPKFSLAETAIFVGKSDTLGGKLPVNDFVNIFTRLEKSAKPAAPTPAANGK